MQIYSILSVLSNICTIDAAASGTVMCLLWVCFILAVFSTIWCKTSLSQLSCRTLAFCKHPTFLRMSIKPMHLNSVSLTNDTVYLPFFLRTGCGAIICSNGQLVLLVCHQQFCCARSKHQKSAKSHWIRRDWDMEQRVESVLRTTSVPWRTLRTSAACCMDPVLSFQPVSICSVTSSYYAYSYTVSYNVICAVCELIICESHAAHE